MKTTLNKLAYIAIGGVLVAFGMIISPLNAQKDKFGQIECTKLVVVDEYGNARITLGDGGISLNSRGLPGLNACKEASVVITPYVMLFSTQGAGLIFYNSPLMDKSVFIEKGGKKVEIGFDEYGGYLITGGKGDSKGSAIMGINKYGNGAVSTYDKNGYLQ